METKKYSLHIAVSNFPEMFEGKFRHRGIVYSEEIFDEKSIYASRIYNDFFELRKSYRSIHLETEIGPQKMVYWLKRKFNAYTLHLMSVGGKVAEFFVTAKAMEKLLAAQEELSQCR